LWGYQRKIQFSSWIVLSRCHANHAYQEDKE